jgi:hypothetical protein
MFAAGVGVGFDLAVSVGDRFGRGLLGWVGFGRGWVKNGFDKKKFFLKKL